MISKIAAWVVGLLSVVLYAYAVFSGVINVQGMLAQAEIFGMSVSALGWMFIVAHLIIPVVLLAIALIVGRGTSAWLRVVILIAGLSVTGLLLLVLTDFESRVLPWQTFFV